jgi:c-di-GMP-binding flagellar brake protein YcgR
MEVEETERPERRAHPRQPVDEDAVMMLVNNGSQVTCRISELSQDGCRMRTKDPFWAGIRVRVETSFKVNGIAFRFLGVTQWTDDKYVVGVQFLSVTDRRRAELQEMLVEVEAKNKAKAELEAAQKLAEEEEAARKQAEEEAAALQALEEVVPKPPKSENVRQSERHAIDGRAEIHFINLGSSVHGRIVDLSLGGCGIRTDDPFPVGIYTRVEIAFHCEGLIFRLIGVIVDVHDPTFVGVRFLDVSLRKRQQLMQLIEEIKEIRASEAAPEDSGEEPLAFSA